MDLSENGYKDELLCCGIIAVILAFFVGFFQFLTKRLL